MLDREEVVGVGQRELVVWVSRRFMIDTSLYVWETTLLARNQEGYDGILAV